MPVVLKAKEEAAARWKTLVGRDGTPEAWARFEELIDEWAFSYVLKAANSDPNYPKVLGHMYGPPHRWFGMNVPGSRGGGGDGPDQHYTLIPIDGYARFELTAKRHDNAPGDVPFVLVGNISTTMTLRTLDWQDVQFDPDGTFLITLDPTPGKPLGSRGNHIQTRLEARYLFVRDCRGDWRQTPNSYRIKRLDPPTAPPLTLEQIAQRAALFIIDDVAVQYWWVRVFAGMEPNTITPPFNSGKVGGLTSQMICFSRLKLADDEAFIVTAGSGGAPFRDVVLHDYWFRTFDYWNHTCSMNNAQGMPNADGSTSYVISIQDPGVHNWLNPVGFHELLMVHRWQGLPRKPVPEGLPWAKGELVKFDALDTALPKDMKRITPAGRQQQLAQRLEQFHLRYLDH